VTNVTISLDESTLGAARKVAEARGLSLNAYLRELIARNVRKPGSKAADDLFELMDRLPKTQTGVTWKREDLYRG
jgi:hypothetical protein